MKSSVIDDILKVEDEADKIVKEAEEKASKIIEEAQGLEKNKTKERLNELKLKHIKELEELNENLNNRLDLYKQDAEEAQKSENLLDDKKIKAISNKVEEVLEAKFE